MRVFVDVGAHYGETLAVALNPKWGFDRVYALEPSAACQRVLQRFRHPRLTVEPIALSNKDGHAKLYGSGLLGGSVYADKKQHTADLKTEMVRLVRASDWLGKNIPARAEIYLKLNCEGGEADILDDLLDSGQINRLTRMFVDFDIRKVPSQAHRQQEIERRLQQAGIRYVTAEGFGCGPQHGVEAWLEWNCPLVRISLAQEIAFALRPPLYDRMVRVLSRILPQRVYWWLGHRFGRLTHARRSA